jgi:hypothetical protein
VIGDARLFPVDVGVALAATHIHTEEHLTSLLHVRFHVEVAEEDDERQHVDDEGVVHPQWEVATSSDTIYTQNQGTGELNLQNKMKFLYDAAEEYRFDKKKNRQLDLDSNRDSHVYGDVLGQVASVMLVPEQLGTTAGDKN